MHLFMQRILKIFLEEAVMLCRGILTSWFKLPITVDVNFAVLPGFYVNVIEQKPEVYFNLKLLNYKIELLDFPWI